MKHPGLQSPQLQAVPENCLAGHRIRGDDYFR